MSEIFLSYRRADAPAAAGRLFDRLSVHFGSDQVFRDIDTIDAGRDFERAIRDAIDAASAVLIVMGREWIDARRPDGVRRLDDPNDYVRSEIELALASGALVIPVLVDEAVMPAGDVLPESIRALATRNAVELLHRRWDGDVAELIRQLEKSGIPPRDASPAGSLAAARGAANVAMLQFLPNLLALVCRPRTFLARYRLGRGSDLVAAGVFFVIAIMAGLLILLAAYTPDQSVTGFALAVYVVGVLGVLAASLPLWIAWTVAGARRHYSKLLVVLLHQAGIVHLVVLVAMAVVIFATDLGSRNIVPDTLAEAMKPGRSASEAVEMMWNRFEPLSASGALGVALPVAGLLLLAGLGWLVASWGAYRDAFELSRGRSVVALFLAISLLIATIVLAA